MKLDFPAARFLDAKALARQTLKEMIAAEIRDLIVKEMQRALLEGKAQREADITALVRDAVREAVAELLSK